jgi:imidazoleglycerol-phosphate dehydratase
MSRTAIVDRNTAETNFHLRLILDGSGKSEIKTAVPFIDHMLTQVAKHGFFDLAVSGEGDTHIDDHHTVEDLGIWRYGHGTMPMHEALVSVHIDFSGRPFLVFNADLPKAKVGTFDVELVEEFCVAFCNHAGANLHVNLHYGENLHHIVEAIFKALGRALDDATQLDPRISGVRSSKGCLD